MKPSVQVLGANVPVVAPRRGGGAEAFSPLRIPDLAGWWDFSDISSLWKDAARTTPVAADGDIIQAVSDKSGNGRHLSEPTTVGPTFKVGQQNGKSVGRFDGINDYLTTTLTLAQPITVVMAGRVVAFEGGTNTNFFDGTVNRAILYASATTPKWSYYAGTLQVGTIDVDTAAHVLDMVFNGASSSLRVDGTVSSTANPGTSGFSTEFRLARDTSSTYYNVDFGELLMYGRALSDAERATLRGWLRGRWGTP